MHKTHGHEQYIAEWKNANMVESVDRIHRAAVVGMLDSNIKELKRILQDVEECVAKDVEQSWRDNPDRMGGQFTQDELNESGWKWTKKNWKSL